MEVMRRLSLILVLLLVTASPLAAQRSDSASVARRLFRVASALFEQGDTASAVDSAVAATDAWPRQGAYLLAAARLAAQAGRPTDAVTLLQRAAEMGFGFDAGVDPFRSLGGVPGFATAAALGQANREPEIASSRFRTLTDVSLHPEGIAFDPGSGRVFVSSVRQRKVVVIEPDGRVADFVGPDHRVLNAVFGMTVDTARGLLWIASSATPEQLGATDDVVAASAILGVDLQSGLIRERWVPADTTPHLLGDVVLAPDGSVWATDSRSPALYRFTPGSVLRGGGTLQRFAALAELGSPQGLAFSSDGAIAWIADWTTGLYRLDVATGVVEPVASPPALFTLGIDGLYRVGPRRLVAIQNGISPARVVALDLDAAGRRVLALSVLDRHLPVAEEPTLGVLVPGGLLYVANAPWGYYGPAGAPRTERPFPAPVLLRLPLER
jgi:hypothetical protein